jgi:hypothetical protein
VVRVDAFSQLRETLIESGYCDNEVEAYDLIKQLLDAGVRFINAEDMKLLTAYRLGETMPDDKKPEPAPKPKEEQPPTDSKRRGYIY